MICSRCPLRLASQIYSVLNSFETKSNIFSGYSVRRDLSSAGCSIVRMINYFSINLPLLKDSWEIRFYKKFISK